MIVKSQIFTQMSGPIAGFTAQPQRTGTVIRARVTPVNPNSDRQVAVRTSVGDLANFWNDLLTPAQRLAWDDYGLNTPLTNRLGDSFVTSGIAHYIRSNVPRLQAGLARVDNAPSVFNTGEPMSGINLGGSSISAGSQELDLVWVNTENPWSLEATSHALFYLGRPQNPGVSFFKGPFRFIDLAEGDPVTPPTNLVSSPTPFVYSAGQKVWIRSRISLADGRLSGASIVGPLIVAA